MCVVGATIGSLGVGAIVEITLPIFLVIYPVIIVLVLLGALIVLCQMQELIKELSYLHF